MCVEPPKATFLEMPLKEATHSESHSISSAAAKLGGVDFCCACQGRGAADWNVSGGRSRLVRWYGHTCVVQLSGRVRGSHRAKTHICRDALAGGEICQRRVTANDLTAQNTGHNTGFVQKCTKGDCVVSYIETPNPDYVKWDECEPCGQFLASDEDDMGPSKPRV